jgi:hypothetical protein
MLQTKRFQPRAAFLGRAGKIFLLFKNFQKVRCKMKHICPVCHIKKPANLYHRHIKTCKG